MTNTILSHNSNFKATVSEALILAAIENYLLLAINELQPIVQEAMASNDYDAERLHGLIKGQVWDAMIRCINDGNLVLNMPLTCHWLEEDFSQEVDAYIARFIATQVTNKEARSERNTDQASAKNLPSASSVFIGILEGLDNYYIQEDFNEYCELTPYYNESSFHNETLSLEEMGW